MTNMPADPPPPSREGMLEWEEKAEAAYAAMYEAESWNQKDLKDDASFYLARALEIAVALRLEDDAQRIRERSENILGVWNSQFRGNFR
jgi:hypothetical protein